MVKIYNNLYLLVIEKNNTVVLRTIFLGEFLLTGIKDYLINV